MPCFVGLFALFIPRVVILILWFFTTWFHGVFDNILWPILGFIFLPTTLLWYTFVEHYFGGTWDALIPIAGVVIAIIIDISPSSARR